MTFLQYFAPALVLLVMAVPILRAEYPCVECRDYHALKKALFTEENIYIPQAMFYPNDGAVVSDCYIHVRITVQKITHFTKGCFE